jgi:hypothetical protein
MQLFCHWQWHINAWAAGVLLTLSTLATPCLAACTAGSYFNSTACVPCPAGRYGATTTLTTALCSGPCPVGTFSIDASAACTRCPASTPFSSPGGGSCYAACPDATWAPWLDVAGVEGAHSCLKRFSSSMLSFDAAQANCSAIGSTGRIHLLTSRQVCAYSAKRKSLCLLSLCCRDRSLNDHNFCELLQTADN